MKTNTDIREIKGIELADDELEAVSGGGALFPPWGEGGYFRQDKPNGSVGPLKTIPHLMYDGR